MKTADHTVMRPALIILHELHLAHIFSEFLLGKCLKKIASMVTEHLWLDNHHSLDFCLDDLHSRFLLETVS